MKTLAGEPLGDKFEFCTKALKAKVLLEALRDVLDEEFEEYLVQLVQEELCKKEVAE